MSFPEQDYTKSLNDIFQAPIEVGSPVETTAQPTMPTPAQEPKGKRQGKPKKQSEPKPAKAAKLPKVLSHDDMASQWMSRAIMNPWLSLTTIGFCGLRIGLAIAVGISPLFQFAGTAIALIIFGAILYNRFSPSKELGAIALQSLSGFVLGDILFIVLRAAFASI